MPRASFIAYHVHPDVKCAGLVCEFSSCNKDVHVPVKAVTAVSYCDWCQCDTVARGSTVSRETDHFTRLCPPARSVSRLVYGCHIQSDTFSDACHLRFLCVCLASSAGVWVCLVLYARPCTSQSSGGAVARWLTEGNKVEQPQNWAQKE